MRVVDGDVAHASADRMLAERVALEVVRIRELGALLTSSEVVEGLGPSVSAALAQLVTQQATAYEGLSTTGVTVTSWERLHQRVRTSDQVLAECLAVIAGARARPLPRVAAACEEAEAVARELYQLTQIAPGHGVIPADAECVSALSSVVRRRYPDHGLWDLPVIAHEFGHLVTRDLLEIDPVSGDDSRPLADLLAGSKRQTAELASDVFAILTMGPAYAENLVLHRMNPLAAAVSAHDATHPGDSSRVAAVLYALGLLGASYSAAKTKQYDFLQEGLADWWVSAQHGVDPEARLDDAGAARVRLEVDKIWRVLKKSKLWAGRYQSYDRARALADDFRRHGIAGAESSCRNVLNAAWLIRFRAWREGATEPVGVTSWAAAQIVPG